MKLDTIRRDADKAFDAADAHICEGIVTIQAIQIAVDRLDTLKPDGEAERIVRTLSCLSERAHREVTAAADGFAGLLDGVMTDQPPALDAPATVNTVDTYGEAFRHQLETYRQARAAFLDYCDGKDNWTDPEGDRLCNQHAAALDRLLQMPAPNAAGLATKLNIAVVEQIAAGWNSGPQILKAFADDANRLFGQL